jgi:hypothetical protein
LVIRRQERERQHLYPYSAEVKSEGDIHSLSHANSWRGAEVDKPKNFFTFQAEPEVSSVFSLISLKQSLGLFH